MKVSLVVAMSRDGLIGREGALPWRLPHDLRHFRKLTWGKPIIMGRKTHETLGRPLPGRTNIVLTRQTAYRADGCLIVHDQAEALSLAADTGASEACVIGGGEVFAMFLPLASMIHLTLVEGQFPGDVYFPARILDSAHWIVLHEEAWPADERNPHDARYLILSRNRDDAAPGATAALGPR